MPRGVYERTERHRTVAAENAAKATAKSAEYWRGRKRSEEQNAAHSARMRGRAPSNKGVPMPKRQKAAQTEHGHAAGGVSPTYVSWRSMIQRCTDPNKGNYKYYGGRGIAVCERWRKFSNFLADMGERPSGMQLSRIDNDGNYEPANVTWATRAENIAERNTRVAAQT